MEQTTTDSEKSGLSFFEKLSRRKLRNYLFLNKQLQFNFAILLAVVGLFTAGYFIALFYIYAKDSLLQLSNYVPDYLLTNRFMQDTYRRFFLTVIFAMVGEFIFVLLLGLFFSHRIAGPLYAIGLKLKTIASGQVPDKLTLRKNDFLGEFADELNLAIEKIEAKQAGIQQALEDLKAGNKQACEEKLKQLVWNSLYPGIFISGDQKFIF